MLTAEAKAREAAMRTITIMLPVRYNELPAHVHQEKVPPSVDPGPSHGPLGGQLLGALSQEPPFVVHRWSARYDVPPVSERSGVSNAPEMDDDKSSKESTSSPLSPGFILRMLTGGRYPPPPRDAQPVWSRSTSNDVHRQHPETDWHPAQLVQRYVELAGHRDGPRGDTLLKNNVVMTAVSYGMLDSDDSRRSTTSTTTTATTNSNQKQRRLSAEYRHRRYRSYPAPGGRRPMPRRRHGFDVSLNSDDEDDEILEALFGRRRSPTVRRGRRPSTSLGARRVYGRKRVGDGDRRRRWRPRDGKPRRRVGSAATRGGNAENQRPGETRTEPAQRQAKPDSRRLSLLHIVVSRQQDFAAPQPPVGFVDHPGLQLPEPRPLDIDALHSLSRHHPFIQPAAPPFLPVVPDTRFHRHQPDRYVVSPAGVQVVVCKLT